ncbi:MAG: ATP-dependent metallopeptidase FtsH/Yme1/Tma family protein, partial [Candidatus Aminicenantes bacterium]|nr:ATP-dependent metallopeptidase FtsH/Yme1/Tma family protein [Candidatus Aminicenantes bacterium]
MPKSRPRPMKNLLFWLTAGIIIIFLWSLVQTPAAAKKDVPFSQFMSDVEAGKIAEVTIT